MLHGNTFLGAGFDARAAGDASDVLDFPHFIRAIDIDRVGGTFLRADCAVNAFVEFYGYMTARRVKGYPFFEGIHERRGFFKEVGDC